MHSRSQIDAWGATAFPGLVYQANLLSFWASHPAVACIVHKNAPDYIILDDLNISFNTPNLIMSPRMRVHLHSENPGYACG